MSSIVGIVAMLATLLMVRALVRAWNRNTDALLEQHLGRAGDFAARMRADRDAARDRGPGEVRSPSAEVQVVRTEA